MYGLSYIPSLGSQKKNDSDAPSQKRTDIKGKNFEKDYTARDLEILRRVLMEMGDRCRVILEIGVARAKKNSSTNVILECKSPEAVYVGVDIKRKRLTGENVHTLAIDSSETEKVMQKIEELTGKREIDFIHIDGWHSVNQVVKDWKYAQYLSSRGIVFFHDTNYHPGPVEVINAIDRTEFKVKKYFVDKSDDWGVSVAWKRR